MNKKNEKTFEEALEELEEIVKKLSEGDMSLDESIKLFEKGMKLKKFLSEKLSAAKNRIKILVEEDNGFNEEDFDVEQ